MSTPAATVRMFKALALAVAIAAPAEGLRRAAYHDPVGIVTICYGSTEQVAPGQTASLRDCHARLSADMLTAIEQVEECVPGLPEHMLAAWGDAAFNLGPRIVCDTKTSTAARLLRAGKLIEACEELPRWNKARVAGQLVPLPGLTARRERERQLCLSGVV
jgi:GH24 family phage-related lysozyme (muramidase)